MNQFDITRGQSFNLEANKPYIYYYAVQKPLPENIKNDLIVCLKIKPHTLKSLPENWYTKASKTASLQVDGAVKYVTWNYILDIFLYIFINSPTLSTKEFLHQAQDRLGKFKIDEESLQSIIEIFHQIVPTIAYSIEQAFCKLEPLNYDKECVRPLVVFREKNKNNDQNVIKLIDDLIQDDDKSDSTNLSMNSTQSKQQENRSKSDMRDITSNLQMNRMKKFTKQMLKMSQNIFDQLIGTTIKDEQWQLARQFVVISLEMNIKAEDYIKHSEKVRFIQPALSFYKKALQLWILEKSSSQNKVTKIKYLLFQIIFSQFICKARQFYGIEWDDKFKIPLFTLFQQVEQMMQISLKITKDPIELLDNMINMLVHKLNELWDQDIIIYAKNLIQQQ